MAGLLIALFCLGILLTMIGSIWTTILAFTEHLGWGFACFFLPFAAFVFILVHWNKKRVRQSFWITILGLVAILSGSVIAASFGASSRISPKQTISLETEAQSSSTAPELIPLSSPTSTSTAPAAQSDSFREAVNAAMDAAVLTQSATSKDDWDLVVSKWQNAISLLKRVPKSNSNYPKAQAKVQEYEKNLNYAQQRSNKSSLR
jgi:glucan phosphoethanolaminetransferase (alkaline phosphatase superfamily)